MLLEVPSSCLGACCVTVFSLRKFLKYYPVCF